MNEKEKEEIRKIGYKLIPGILAFTAATLLIKYYG